MDAKDSNNKSINDNLFSQSDLAGALYPVLPLKNGIVYPNITTSLSVGRPKAVAAVDEALSHEEKTLVVLVQKNPSEEKPSAATLYHIGVKVTIRRVSRNENGIEMLVQGSDRMKLKSELETEPYFRAYFERLPMPEDFGPQVEALSRDIISLISKIDALNVVKIPSELSVMVQSMSEPLDRVYLLAWLLGLDTQKAQSVIEAPTRIEALKIFHAYLTQEVQVLELQSQIASRAANAMGKERREYLLRQQLRAIQQELGEGYGTDAELDILRGKLEKIQLPEKVRSEVDRELHHLEQMPPSAPDYQMTRSYLDLVAELPWGVTTEDQLDIARARAVLDEDHFDLKDVKQRIIEHIAVMNLNPQAKSPILCFVGPPGVGKTSLGKSIARALGRPFERISLGGMHDEAELRGHRRTYIGAMPGVIIQSLRRAGALNPLIMLDEVDKLGRDFRGDPSSALLEVLDPSQNHEFRDNYLNLPFDLSKVMFITTANTLESIPRPLLDRMEVLRLSGYTEEEKLEIAKRYLVPRQLSNTGLSSTWLTFTDEAIAAIIRRYTREAGVRELERFIGRLARQAAIRLIDGHQENITIDSKDLDELLGPDRFFAEQSRKKMTPGVAIGLAWTEAGGDVLYVEAVAMPGGRSHLTLTGQLGDVMKESAKTALTCIRTIADELHIPPERFVDAAFHVHVPAGAIPKDGPSAGITIATALASYLTGTAMPADTAMTGEISLTGLVLPVGGVKEKILAARRAGLKRVLLPKDNFKNLQELPKNVRAELELIPVTTIEEVLEVVIPEAFHEGHDEEGFGSRHEGQASRVVEGLPIQ